MKRGGTKARRLEGTKRVAFVVVAISLVFASRHTPTMFLYRLAVIFIPAGRCP